MEKTKWLYAALLLWTASHSGESTVKSRWQQKLCDWSLTFSFFTCLVMAAILNFDYFHRHSYLLQQAAWQCSPQEEHDLPMYCFINHKVKLWLNYSFRLTLSRCLCKTSIYFCFLAVMTLFEAGENWQKSMLWSKTISIALHIYTFKVWDSFAKKIWSLLLIIGPSLPSQTHSECLR